MAGDSEVIRALQKQLGIKLPERPLEKIQHISENGYACDGNGYVVGLDLDHNRSVYRRPAKMRITNRALYY